MTIPSANRTQHTLSILRSMVAKFPAPPPLCTPDNLDEDDAFAYLDRGVSGVLFVPKRDLLLRDRVLLVPQWSPAVLRAAVQDTVETLDAPGGSSWSRFATAVLSAGDDGPGLRAIAAQVATVITWPLFSCAPAGAASYSKAFRAHHANRLRDSIHACRFETVPSKESIARPVFDLDISAVCTRDRLRDILLAWSDIGLNQILDLDDLVLAIMRIVYFNPVRTDNMCFRLRGAATTHGTSSKSTSLRRVSDTTAAQGSNIAVGGSGIRMSPVDVGFVIIGDGKLAPRSVHDMAETVLETTLWELRGTDLDATARRGPTLATRLLCETTPESTIDHTRRTRAIGVLDRFLFEVLPRRAGRDAREYAAIQQRVACYVLHFLHVTRDMAPQIAAIPVAESLAESPDVPW